MSRWILKTLSDDLFTDREKWLESLYHYGVKMTEGKTFGSTALIGLRRLGKTELFKRVYNRLFFEQDEVVPVFWSYEGKNLENPDFSRAYLQNFLRQYFAFKNKKMSEEILRYDLSKLMDFGLNEDGSRGMIEVLERFRNESGINEVNQMLTIAINAPRTVSDYNEELVIVFVDEFQEVLKVRNKDGGNPNCIGNYQEAVESLECPHIITGSSKSLILYDILRTGPLFARFDLDYFEGMNDYHGRDLVIKWCKKLNVKTEELFALWLARKCGGNPYYIGLIVKDAARLQVPLNSVDNILNVYTYSLLEGRIWSELERQVQGFVNQQNRKGIGRELIYHASKYDTINYNQMEEIAGRLGRSFEEVRQMLTDLAWADLLEADAMKGWYFVKVKDPVLNEFLQAWCEVEVENKERDRVKRGKFEEYKSLEGRYNYFKGVAVEIYILYLMSKWRNEEVDGKAYFGIDKKIKLPKFDLIDNRLLKDRDRGRKAQVDIIGLNLFVQWFGECKYLKEKVDIESVRDLAERKADIGNAVFGEKETVLWFFGRKGFTKGAIEYMEERGILYSDEEMLNKLLTRYHVRTLPEDLDRE